jgi:hypothetical protein
MTHAGAEKKAQSGEFSGAGAQERSFPEQTFIGATLVPTIGTQWSNASFTHEEFANNGRRTMRPKRTSIGVSRMSRFRNKQKRRQAKHYRGQGRPS